MIIRFPRTDDDALNYMVEKRIQYPPPPYDWKRDGSQNPADWILGQLLKYSKKKLRRLCVKHALEPEGPRRRLVWRMWMHWRAKKLMIGRGEYYGYGKGYMNTRPPTCSCGYLRKDYKVKKIVEAKKGVTDGRQRFPRL